MKNFFAILLCVFTLLAASCADRPSSSPSDSQSSPVPPEDEITENVIITDITNIGDPQILLYNDVYYCYATSLGYGFRVWRSSDLINWSEPITCYDGRGGWGDYNFWAPEVVYHNGKFVMHYSVRSKYHLSLRIGVAVADNPLGPFIDVYDGPMFDFGYATIDASILIADDGNYMYYSRDCSENRVGEDYIRTSQIYCVKVNDDLTKTIGEPVLVSTPTEDYETVMDWYLGVRWNEGPAVIKVGDQYVMNYSANYYASNEYAICAATAPHPMGPWKKSANNPIRFKSDLIFGAGHNYFFTAKDGQLYTSFHIQTNPEAPSGNRRLAIGKVTFSQKNGDLYQTIT